MRTQTYRRPVGKAALLAALSFLSSLSLTAQSGRDLRAERIVVDDNNGHTITIQTPQPPAVPMAGNYLVTIPEPSVSGAAFLLSHPPFGSSGQTVHGGLDIDSLTTTALTVDLLNAGSLSVASLTAEDSIGTDLLQAPILQSPAANSLRIQSNGSVVVGIDEDNNGTGSSFAVETNAAPTPDLFRVTETGLTDVTSSSATGGFRVTNTNAGGTVKIIELLDGSSAKFTVRRNGNTTVAGDLTVDGAGTSTFAGSVTVGDFFSLTQESQTGLAGGGTLPVNGSHILVAGGSGAVTLSGTTAIANGSSVGQVLVLVGNSNANMVTINDGANTDLGANRMLGQNDALMLIWNGSDWIEMSFVDN